MKESITKLKEIVREGPIGIYLMAFLIPFYQNFFGVATAIIILEFLVRRTAIRKEFIKSQLSWKNPGIWLFAFYLLHIVGLIHTENMKFANLDIGMKATLGIFPLLFVFYQPKINWRLFVNSFILGALVSIVVNLTISIGLYLDTGSIKHFYDSRLTHLMHRGYWAVYLAIAIFFLLKRGLESSGSKAILINFSLAFFIAIFAILSISKMGLILLVIQLVWLAIMLIRRFQYKWILPLIATIFLVTAFSAYYFIPAMKPRIDSTFKEMVKPVDEMDQNRPGSTGARMLVWKSSVELIKENFWFGVGTGDIKDELIQRNIDNGYSGVAEKKLNSHNQYLNSHLALGVLAPLFLLMVIITNCIKRAGNDRYYSWRVGVVLMLFLAMFTESMLEVEAGIIPYAFLLSFLPVFKEEV